MVAILVVPYKDYQLYYRDPKTRSFKPLQTSDGEKYSVQFAVDFKKIDPQQLILSIMTPDYGGSRMFSRKQDLQYWSIYRTTK